MGGAPDCDHEVVLDGASLQEVQEAGLFHVPMWLVMSKWDGHKEVEVRAPLRLDIRRKIPIENDLPPIFELLLVGLWLQHNGIGVIVCDLLTPELLLARIFRLAIP